ncbi:hypothetical protein NPIL_407021 [Nephila pilipes]|uniref:Uncharacterized protein n=1 Tax=Nephila pilipes TaxID=299642 RepID=A0A8X6P9L7_NEPPI|nr:hypothetical protein NPIL_407021 [Nephila pilipes]
MNSSPYQSQDSTEFNSESIAAQQSVSFFHETNQSLTAGIDSTIFNQTFSAFSLRPSISFSSQQLQPIVSLSHESTTFLSQHSTESISQQSTDFISHQPNSTTTLRNFSDHTYSFTSNEPNSFFTSESGEILSPWLEGPSFFQTSNSFPCPPIESLSPYSTESAYLFTAESASLQPNETASSETYRYFSTSTYSSIFNKLNLIFTSQNQTDLFLQPGDSYSDASLRLFPFLQVESPSQYSIESNYLQSAESISSQPDLSLLNEIYRYFSTDIDSTVLNQESLSSVHQPDFLRPNLPFPFEPDKLLSLNSIQPTAFLSQHSIESSSLQHTEFFSLLPDESPPLETTSNRIISSLIPEEDETVSIDRNASFSLQSTFLETFPSLSTTYISHQMSESVSHQTFSSLTSQTVEYMPIRPTVSYFSETGRVSFVQPHLFPFLQPPPPSIQESYISSSHMLEIPENTPEGITSQDPAVDFTYIANIPSEYESGMYGTYEPSADSSNKPTESFSSEPVVVSVQVISTTREPTRAAYEAASFSTQDMTITFLPIYFTQETVMYSTQNPALPFPEQIIPLYNESGILSNREKIALSALNLAITSAHESAISFAPMPKMSSQQKQDNTFSHDPSMSSDISTICSVHNSKIHSAQR